MSLDTYLDNIYRATSKTHLDSMSLADCEQTTSVIFLPINGDDDDDFDDDEDDFDDDDDDFDDDDEDYDDDDEDFDDDDDSNDDDNEEEDRLKWA